MSWLTEERLRLYPRAILAALVLAFVLSVLSGSGAETAAGRLGGDLPSFWGAGRVVVEGNAAALYTWEAQHSAQAGLFPTDAEDGALWFAYPPFVALAYAPLALLPFRAAYVVHTLLMAAAVALGVHLLGRDLERVRRYHVAALAGALCFYPMLRAVGGAQNTPVTFLILAATLHLAVRGRDLQAGLVLGLLAFKPQLAIVPVGLFLVGRRPLVVLGAAATGIALYGAAAAVWGPGWPVHWWAHGVVPFRDLDEDVNFANSIGCLGFAEALFGTGTPAARLLGGGSALVVAATAAWAWWRGTPDDLPERMGLAAVASLLVAPHAMFYDGGIAVLALLVLAARDGRAAAPAVLLLGIASYAQSAGQALGFAPLFLVTLATWALLVGRRWTRPVTATGAG